MLKTTWGTPALSGQQLILQELYNGGFTLKPVIGPWLGSKMIQNILIKYFHEWERNNIIMGQIFLHHTQNSPDKMTVASSLNWTQLTFCGYIIDKWGWRSSKKPNKKNKQTLTLKLKTQLNLTKSYINRTDPCMTSEFTCNLACCNIPQDHCFIRAAGANLTVVKGTVNQESEIQ